MYHRYRFKKTTSVIVLAIILIFCLSCSKNPTPPTEPDHYMIAFESYRNGYNNIFTMNDDGSEQGNLTLTLDGEQQPEWSYDGKRILYQSTFEVVGIQFLGIFMMSADGTNKSRYTAVGSHASQATNPPNSELIVYHAIPQRATEGDIHIVNYLGTYHMQMTDSPGDDHSPAVNPIYNYIAFISNRDGNSELYVMNGSGGNQRNLSLNPGNDGDLDWSPDGTKIAWVSERSGNTDIYTVNPEGASVQTQLTTYNGTDLDPNWSPDGSKIAFMSTRGGSGNPNIYVMNADGTDVTQLTSGSFNTSPQWSPDGRLIAFVSLRDNNTEIYVMNADGSNQTRLTFNPGNDGHPRWCHVPIDEM